MYSPVISTLQKALDKNWLSGLPGLTSQSLKQHTPHSKATAKGHMDQSRKNQQSTKPKPDNETETSMDDCFPPGLPPGLRTHRCYASILTLDFAQGQISTDQTGRFPITSSRGNKYLFCLYDYDSNLIDAVPIKNREAASILAAYKLCVAKLVRSGLRPQLQRLDNECSTALKEFMKDEQVDYQLVPPGQHRRNPSERAICTLKNHLIAGIASCDPNFPLHLWCYLMPQCLLTLNLMRGSRINPKLSAWAQVNGPYDYNKTPMGPPGTQILAHEKPSKRGTFASHAKEGWYIGPAMESYRCYQVWIPETRATRIVDTLDWFPKQVTMPIASSMDLILAAARDLATALQHPSTNSPLSPLEHSEVETLRQLQQILLNRQVQPSPTPPKPVSVVEPSPPTPEPAPLVPPVKPSSDKLEFAPDVHFQRKSTLRSHTRYPATATPPAPSQSVEPPPPSLRVDPATCLRVPPAGPPGPIKKPRQPVRAARLRVPPKTTKPRRRQPNRATKRTNTQPRTTSLLYTSPSPRD